MIGCDRASVARGRHIVVEGVTLTVPGGQTLAVIGLTGAGKSSLVAAIAGVVPLHTGDISVARHSVRREAAAVARLVGYVPDRLPAWPGLEVRGLVEMAAAAGDLSGRRLQAAVDDALETYGLTAHGRTPLDALPAGAAKRALLARALVHDPPVLLLDDPFGGLDPRERDELEAGITAARSTGCTVVAALDDGVVPSCFSHLAVMHEGRLVESGPADASMFAVGRRWRVRIVCPSRAADAVRVLAGLATDLEPQAADIVACRIDPGAVLISRLVAALVAADIPVEAAGFHPPWTAQVLMDSQ
jgi:ABC-type multidrug transport system ATPase subunit